MRSDSHAALHSCARGAAQPEAGQRRASRDPASVMPPRTPGHKLRCLGPGAWGLGPGAWGLGPGAWGLGPGAWGLGPDAWVVSWYYQTPVAYTSQLSHAEPWVLKSLQYELGFLLFLRENCLRAEVAQVPDQPTWLTSLGLATLSGGGGSGHAVLAAAAWCSGTGVGMVLHEAPRSVQDGRRLIEIRREQGVDTPVYQRATPAL
jgi:hypothetical protein